MEKPNRHVWEEDSTHRSVAGFEYDEVWDYAEQLEAENERLRGIWPSINGVRYHLRAVLERPVLADTIIRRFFEALGGE